MTKAISYSLFGFNKEKYNNCFDFESYMSGLMLCIRMNRLVYPDWVTVVHVQEETYLGFQEFFSKLDGMRDVKVKRIEVGNFELCEAMLWRLLPIFETEGNGDHTYTHVICRDLDSLSTLREAQAVKMWVDHDKALHAITDSVSHTIPMLGGMIGFRPGPFKERMDVYTFQDLMRKCDFDLVNKGTDQKFINRVIYPVFSKQGEDSITQHYFKGHPNTWLSDFHTCQCWVSQDRRGHESTCALNNSIPDVDGMGDTDEVAEHIGAAGYNHNQTWRVIHKNEERFKDLLEIEKDLPDYFYWIKK